MKLFHLDRAQSLRRDQDINLLPLSCLPDDVRSSCLFHFFPNGISQFGIQVVQPTVTLIRCVQTYDAGDLLVADDFQRQKSLSDIRMMELVLETVRQAHFSSNPSRLTSLFATGSISDFVQWPELLASKQFVVWELEAPDDTPRFDSNLLKGGECFSRHRGGYSLGYLPAAAYDFASKYWDGTSTTAPRWEYLVSLPVQATRLRRVSEQEIQQHLRAFHQRSNDV